MTLFLILLCFLIIILAQLPQKKITFTPRAAVGVIPAYFAPASVTAVTNTTFTSSIRITPTEPIALQLYKIVVNFDKNKASVDGINYLVGVASAAHNADTDATKDTMNSTGVITLVGLINNIDGQVINSATGLVQITFKSKVAGQYSITINNSQSNLVKVKADATLETIPLLGGSLSVNGGTGPTATQPVTTVTQPVATATQPVTTVTEAPPPGGGFTLNLKLKFQGVLKKPASGMDKMPVKVTAVSSGNKLEKTTEFSSDDHGVWTGQAFFEDMPIRPNYKVLIKGPKHIQKKVCVAIPTETYPGTYGCADGNINIKTGENNLDFSGIYLLVGDLPDQDGIVNAYDSSLVVNNLYKTDSEAVRIADLNLDGAVNAMDYSLVIAALSVRADEQ